MLGKSQVSGIKKEQYEKEQYEKRQCQNNQYEKDKPWLVFWIVGQ